MKVLVIGHLTGKDIRPHLRAEGRRVAELRNEGLIRDVFLKADRTGPILLLNDTSAHDAQSRLTNLPFVEHELVTFDYIELDDNSFALWRANIPSRAAAAIARLRAQHLAT